MLGSDGTCAACPSSGERSLSELLVRSLMGLESWRSLVGVLRRSRGVWPPSSLRGERTQVSAPHKKGA